MEERGNREADNKELKIDTDEGLPYIETAINTVVMEKFFMIVRYWMTEYPVTVREETSLHEAFLTMKRNRVRRLPVTDSKDRLSGLLTLRMILPGLHLDKELSPAEEADMKHRMASDAMTGDGLVTCGPNDPIEEVGALMRARKIGTLPVIGNDKLVGIITESDILDALATIARAGDSNTRVCLSVPVENKTGIIFEIVDLCKRYRMDLLTVLVHPLSGSKRHLVMVRVDGSRTREFLDALWGLKYQVISVLEQKKGDSIK